MLKSSITGFIMIFAAVIRMNHTNQKVINIDVASPGILGNVSASSITLGGPAYDISLGALKDSLPDFNITHTYLYDERIKDCDTLQTEVQNILARWYYTVRQEDRFTVIITPGCIESAQLNQFAASWNVLLITTANTDRVLHDKSKSPTWVTTNLYPSVYYGDVFYQLLIYHKWTSIEMLLDQNVPGFASWPNAIRLTQALLKQYDVQSFSEEYSSANPYFTFNFTAFLTMFSTRNRVLLFLGPPTQLRKLLATARLMNMTNGEYVYISAFPFPWRGYGNFSWQYGDSDDQVVRKAYESVIMITMIDLSVNLAIHNINRLVAGWKERFRQEPFYRNTRLETDPPLPQLTSTTAAIEIFGQVLRETRQANPDFTLETGTTLARRMINDTFNTSVGNVTFDRYGERRPLLVTASYFDPSTATFKAYLQSDIQEGDFRWRQIHPVLWHGRPSLLPPSEPGCGFMGTKETCGTTGDYSIAIILLPVGFLLCGVIAIAFIVSRGIYCLPNDKLWWSINDAGLHAYRSLKMDTASC